LIAAGAKTNAKTSLQNITLARSKLSINDYPVEPPKINNFIQQIQQLCIGKEIAY
jgi:hypothetical protein